MKKKLDTRFPAARIKKIMQSDEEVGKIALATPVLISKALELFLQDLCNKTYRVTLSRGAKTISGVHLRRCVLMNSQYDFLREIVNKVSETGSAEGSGNRETCRSNSDEDEEEGCSDSEIPPRLQRNEVNSVSSKGRANCKRKNGVHKDPKSDNFIECRDEKKSQGKPKGNQAFGRRAKAEAKKISDKTDEESPQPSTSNRNEVERSTVEEAIEVTNPCASKDAAESTPRDFDLNMDLNQVPDEIEPGVKHKRQKAIEESRECLFNGDSKMEESLGGSENSLDNEGEKDDAGIQGGRDATVGGKEVSWKSQIDSSAMLCSNFGDEDDYDD